jgi:hypothetical protein
MIPWCGGAKLVGMKVVFESSMLPEAVQAFQRGYENPDSLPPIVFYTRADMERLKECFVVPETEKE